MNITKFKSELPKLLKHRVTANLVGKHGIGKSSIVEQVCRENGYMYVLQCLGTKEVGDLQGLLDVGAGYVKFLSPKFVVDVNNWARANPDKYAVIHLDEINHINKDMQAILFGALLGNRIGDVEMESNVRYVTSMNPPTKDYPGVFDFRNAAMIDRLCWLELSPSPTEWAAYARNVAKIDDAWVEFALATPSVLNPAGEAYDVLKNVKGSPRSLTLAAQLHGDGVDAECIEGIIGSAAMAGFQAFSAKREEDLVKVADILGRKSLTKKTQATLAAWTKDEQYGKIEALVSMIKAKFSGMEPDTGSQEDAFRIQELVELLPIDIAYSMMLDLTDATHRSINMKFDEDVHPKAQKFWAEALKSGKVKPNVG